LATGFTDALIDKRRFFGDESDLCDAVDAPLIDFDFSVFLFSSLLTYTVVVSGIAACAAATPQSSPVILLNLGDVYNACLI
jgi:hypothetical protein